MHSSQKGPRGCQQAQFETANATEVNSESLTDLAKWPNGAYGATNDIIVFLTLR